MWSELTGMVQGESSHPKLEKLEEIVVEHFRKCKNPSSRIMIFSSYRDSVQEITKRLERHSPLVKAMSFVGQNKSTGTVKGFTQKEQMMVRPSLRSFMIRFRGSN